MNQQPPSPERAPLSRRFALLSMLRDLASDEVFREELRALQSELTAELRLWRGKGSVTVRHLVTAGGLDRFVLFIDGRQFDRFDFLPAESSGFDLDTSRQPADIRRKAGPACRRDGGLQDDPAR